MNKPLCISFSVMFAIMVLEAVVAFNSGDYMWMITFCVLSVSCAVTAIIIKERDLQ